MKHGGLHRACLKNLGSLRGQFQHLFVSHAREPPRASHDAGIGCVDAVDIGVDVATVSSNRRRNCDCTGIRSAAAERGDAVVACHALETGDHRCLPFRDSFVQLARVDADNARRAVHGRGAKRNLPSEPRARIDVHGGERDCEEPRGDLFAGGHHHVAFARIMQRRQIARPPYQLVGLSRHGRDDHRDRIAAFHPRLHQLGDVTDAVEIGHRGAAEFHNDLGHRALGAAFLRVWSALRDLS